MRYVILMNGNYMNTFDSYSAAAIERSRLLRKFPNARVEILSEKEYKGV